MKHQLHVFHGGWQQFAEALTAWMALMGPLPRLIGYYVIEAPRERQRQRRRLFELLGQDHLWFDTSYDPTAPWADYHRLERWGYTPVWCPGEGWGMAVDPDEFIEEDYEQNDPID